MGSQAKTYTAVDKRAGRAVAIKQFHVAHADSWKDVELAEREAKVLAALTHPHLPAYYDHFEEEGTLYLVMEHIEGEDLRSLLAAGKLSQADVVNFLQGVAQVLTYLHHRAPPVIHRDIKPANIIRRPDGQFCLVDFGSVRQKLLLDGGSTVVGTYGFMAPEQFQGRALPCSDIYAAGATALTMLTGLPPEELPHRGLNIDVDAALGTTVPSSLKAALKRMVDTDPDTRASDLALLLQEHRVESPSEKNNTAPFGPPRASAAGFGGRAQAHSANTRPKPPRGERSPGGKSGGPDPWGASRERAETPEALLWLAYLPPPFKLLVLVLVSLMTALAHIALSLAFRIVLPLVFWLLSIVFGSELRRTAHELRQIPALANQDLRWWSDAISAALRRKPAWGHRARRQRGWHPSAAPPPNARPRKPRTRVPNSESRAPSQRTVETTGQVRVDVQEAAAEDEFEETTHSADRARQEL